MKTHIINKHIILSLIAVTLVSFSTVVNKGNELEKIYTHTDRTLYFPGETIWFKSYVVNAENKVSTINDIMVAELISPKGEVVKTINLSIYNGYCYGDFKIDKDWVGGIYTLKTYTNWMKNFGEESFFSKKITVQKIVQPNLLLNLKFEKEAYGKGSEVIANFEGKNLENNPINNKEISFEVSIDGKKEISGKVMTNSEGKTDLKFALPENLNTSDVILNVLVSYEGDTESISRSVPVILDNIDLQFLPESGLTIEKTQNTIAFKALNEFGKPADVEGFIEDENGNFVTNFVSYHDGMGSFQLNPKADTQYFAKIKKPFASDSLYKVPTAQKEGVKFSVINSSEKEIALNVYSTNNTDVKLNVLNNSSTLYKKDLSLKKGDNTVKINSKTFSMGITKISILKREGFILCERLLFVNQHKKLNVEILTDKENYKNREKVKISIKTTDEKKRPIASNLSVSVVDNKLLSVIDDKQDHILSSLLLSSELKGKIHEPIFYFDKDEKKAEKALDYVMLTHGWRSYIKNLELDVTTASFAPALKSLHTGYITNNKGKRTTAHLLLFDNNSKDALMFDTDANGNYNFKTNPHSDYTLLAYRDDKKPVTIIENPLYESAIPSYPSINNSADDKNENLLNVQKPLQNTVKQKPTSNISTSLNENSSSLDESIVVGYGSQLKRDITGSIDYVEREDLKSLDSGDVGFLLQGRVAGTSLKQGEGQSGNQGTITIRGVNSISGNHNPLIIVDGVPYTGVNQSLLSEVNSGNISTINVLKGVAATSMYGSRALNGAIIISTQNDYNSNVKLLSSGKFNNYSIKTFYVGGHYNLYPSREFYMPQYNNEIETHERSDFRQTLYWNPVVQTDENGEATIELYNSDAITSYKVVAEGIGYNGLVGRNEKDYSTKKLLSIDFKTPNYLTINDTVELSVNIKNNTDKQISSILQLKLPEEIVLAEQTDFNVRIKAGSFLVKKVKITPVSKSNKTHITASVVTEDDSDVLKKELTILSPYFPIQSSVSGFKNQSFSLPINDVVKNTLSAELTIYTDIAGEVMNGVESMISEPYGCFEQVSSSTYPNVLILKYLKETGQNNPDISQKAMAFIKKGYRKLASYETSENGFEWYGDTPPHEALSAFGIMEFTEMKEVYDEVDEKMIERTVKWLLSRRDHKGGFKQNAGKYGFSAAPENVNNAYIVYAISESGIEVDIEKEYNHAYNEAIKSNDTYRMALMACAGYNLNKTEKTSVLINKIKNNLNNYGIDNLPVEHTITRSNGISKINETVAFSILALLKEGTLESETLKAVEYLTNNRNQGRFGSTQATCMSIKALIEVTKYQKSHADFLGDFVNLHINGQVITRELIKTSNGKLVFRVDDFFSEGIQNITIEYSNPELQLPYSLDFKWDSALPGSSKECKLQLNTTVSNNVYKVGDNVRMNIDVKNKGTVGLPMGIAIIGIPSGTTAQPWQLKELIEHSVIDYYEIFDNYLVFYWKEFAPNETKTINLDLKADVAGTYKAPASTVYLYYADEFKDWLSGNEITIK